MKYYKYIIENKQFETEGTYIYTLRPENETIQFTPGQYVFLKDPKFAEPEEEHPFSIASPSEDTQLEFCIKQYGDWTESFAQRDTGDSVYVSDPQGNFVWNKDYSYVVFLLGGIGISPIMSMLRTLQQEGNTSEIVMIYGNRTPNTIAYKKELNHLVNVLPDFKLVDVFSDIPEDHPWTGYRGFITEDIIQKEIHLEKKPTFFFIGPPIFLEKMNSMLNRLEVNRENMKTESLAKNNQ